MEQQSCDQRHGISRFPEVEGTKPAKTEAKKYPLGYFHTDSAEVHTQEGCPSFFVAIDRATTCAFAELHAEATRRMAANFLQALIAAVPYTIHAVLTDLGTPFTELSHVRTGTDQQEEGQHPEGLYLTHAFVYACEQAGIEHRLTEPAMPGLGCPRIVYTDLDTSWLLAGFGEAVSLPSAGVY